MLQKYKMRVDDVYEIKTYFTSCVVFQVRKSHHHRHQPTHTLEKCPGNFPGAEIKIMIMTIVKDIPKKKTLV